MLYTVAVGPAKAKNFKFAKFVFTSGNGCNFCGANVQSDNNGLFAVHNCMCFCCVLIDLTPSLSKGEGEEKLLLFIDSCFLQFIIYSLTLDPSPFGEADRAFDFFSTFVFYNSSFIASPLIPLLLERETGHASYLLLLRKFPFRDI